MIWFLALLTVYAISWRVDLHYERKITRTQRETIETLERTGDILHNHIEILGRRIAVLKDHIEILKREHT